MSALLSLVFSYADVILVGNLAAGCYAALWFVPELDAKQLLRSPLMRVTIVVAIAVLGIPFLVCLAIGAQLERRGHYYPPASGRRS